jgi:hypothetical protein
MDRAFQYLGGSCGQCEGLSLLCCTYSAAPGNGRFAGKKLLNSPKIVVLGAGRLRVP